MSLPKVAIISGLALLSTNHALAVTQYKPAKFPFLYDITTFKSSLSLPLSDRNETIALPVDKMQQRLQKSQKDDTVEPLSLTMTDNKNEIATMAKKIAIAGKDSELATYLLATWKKSRPIFEGSASRTVEIDRAGFKLINSKAFGEIYGRVHHKLTIDGNELQKNPETKRELISQMAPFFNKKERREFLDKVALGEAITVDQDLLPDFAARMVGKYIIYRGPNCFHAALAFQSPKLTSSALINVKQEKGYHRAMINYDELWRVINSDFYEVNPETAPLKYGDMLVFFEVPKDEATATGPVDFHWIRHTATYLFGGYTFSKGSKSPNTPYTIRTLPEEWQTWKRYTQNLGIKVFRRSEKRVKSHPPMDLADWIY